MIFTRLVLSTLTGLFMTAGVATTSPASRAYSGPIDVPARSLVDDRHGTFSELLSPSADRDPFEVTTLKRRRVTWTPGVQVRAHIGWVSPFTLDASENRYREAAFVTGRIRLNPRLSIGEQVHLRAMLDFANGRWAPTVLRGPVLRDIQDNGQPPISTEPRRLDARELVLTWITPSVSITIGQTGFTWGFGMVFNDGNNVDRFGDLRFGDDGPGDLYERILITGRLGPNLTIGLGGDLVYRDELAQLRDGDRAGQILALVDWHPTPRRNLALITAIRHQSRDQDQWDIATIDAFGRGVYVVGPNITLYGGLEAALQVGGTTALSELHESHRIVQGGVFGRGYVGFSKHGLVGVDAGFASGDADPTDARQTRFEFDRGLSAGLMLFQQSLGWQTARAARIAEQGAFGPVPSRQALASPTRGRVHNTTFVHPKIRVAFADAFELWGGPLFAWASAPPLSPDLTALRGGTPTGWLGGDGANRFYGTELDLGVRGRVSARGLWFQFGAQGGLLRPGPVFRDAQGNRDRVVGTLLVRSEIRY